MCFEVIFPIVVVGFSVFGLYAVITFVGETWFGSDNISVCLTVETEDALLRLDDCLKEARKKPMAHSGGITVLVYEKYADGTVLRKLERQKIRYYVLNIK